ncbi:hypothetical protein BV22DRAFT_209693 [Leucogyrophana mollusca]|uniref:Uncharacterized protein n=1 Tax=Leucogyrophana mollusca TaxID=85980 RepID=A0ACB8BTH1_9AGAM|nr:hypothetical protein BV22DRAFT_209693 [Leucogyrophana mollusca]
MSRTQESHSFSAIHLRASGAPSTRPILASNRRVPRAHGGAGQRGTLYTFAAVHFDHIPKGMWDRGVLFAFSFCLLLFLRALTGLGDVEDVSCPAHLPRFPPSLASAIELGTVRARLPHVPRQVVIDWHGDYELLTKHSPPHDIPPAPAAIPQDAFPGPTAFDSITQPQPSQAYPSSSPPGQEHTPLPGVPFYYDTYAMPYDPFDLEQFEGFNDNDRNAPEVYVNTAGRESSESTYRGRRRCRVAGGC